MVISSVVPLPLSSALTLTMPFSSIENVTSICGGSPRGRRDAGQVELAEHLVLRGQFALALEDPDLHRRLVVRRSGEDLRLLGRNRRILLDESLEEAALDLDTERERRHVQQDDVVNLAAEHAALNRRAQRDGLIGVGVLLGRLTGQLFDLLGDLGHPGRAADQEDFVDLVRVVTRVLERLLGRVDGAIDRSDPASATRTWLESWTPRGGSGRRRSL